MPETAIADIGLPDIPILCLDTCIVLDLMRDPTRKTVRAHERQAALDLLMVAESRKQLIVLIADQVKLELTEHLDSVQEEATQAIENLRSLVVRIEAVASIYGGVGSADLSHLDDHCARARKIVDRWIMVATPALQSPDIASRALTRLNKAQTPARKGKDSMKDCVVVETYLDLVRKLRAGGHKAAAVFASSNVKDFAEETGSTPKPDLASEFAALRLEYAPNMAVAKHHLRL